MLQESAADLPYGPYTWGFQKGHLEIEWGNRIDTYKWITIFFPLFLQNPYSYPWHFMPSHNWIIIHAVATEGKRWVSLRAASKAGVWFWFIACARAFLHGDGLRWVASWQLPRLLFSFLSCEFGVFFFNSSSHLASPNYFLLLITSTGNRLDCWIKSPIKG